MRRRELHTDLAGQLLKLFHDKAISLDAQSFKIVAPLVGGH